MKALSVKQPWAELIASVQKTIETRKWATFYRGPILICASKQIDHDACMAMECDVPVLEKYPTGIAVCIATLVDCRPMTFGDETAACCDVYPGAVAWVLKDIRRVNPVAVKGQLGLFEVGNFKL